MSFIYTAFGDKLYIENFTETNTTTDNQPTMPTETNTTTDTQPTMPTETNTTTDNQSTDTESN